jgi:phosphoglycerate dehydrogenase-like enzyme
VGKPSVNVACVGFVFDEAAQAIIRAVAPPGFVLSFAERPETLDETGLATADFLLTVAPTTDAMMARAPRLRLIQKWGTGVDKIDLAAADRHGIPVTITSGANARSIAEHAILLMLAVLRRVVVADRSVRDGVWNPAALRPVSRSLWGRTVGIVGFGSIGRAVARRLQGFEARVLYHRPSGPVAVADRGAGEGASFVGFEQLLAESDVLTLHCPGGSKNRHLIDAAAIGRMKPGAILVNTARGELVDEAALVAALKAGHLGGAGLDVFDPEPLAATSPLRAMPQVVLTPHAAGSVPDDVAPMARHGFANMERALRGEAFPAADVVVAPARPRVFPGAGR